LSSAIGLLRAGTNVLCLQAFNRSLTDEDFRIDAELAETPGTFAWATNTYMVREDAIQLVVRVVRTGGLDAGMTVDYATTNGSAVAGSDYEAVAGTLSFAEGQTEQTITVRIYNDALIEGTEDFQLKLSNPGGGAMLGSVSNATVQITDVMNPADFGSWTAKTNMLAPTTAQASCVVDGILYVIGGCYPVQTALRTVWAYDPKTDLWARKADLPVARRCPGAAAVDGIIYVVGGNNGDGWTAVLPVAAYDPKTDTWVTKANIPIGRSTPAACAVDGIIYAIGGFTDQNEELARVEAYDPKTDQWTRKSDVPKPIYFATASVVDGVIYVFRGTDTFAYDPQTDHWTAKAQYSPWSMGLRSATVDGIIYVFGGFSQDLTVGFDFAQAYDPKQDRFTPRRKMPRTRAAMGCGAIDGKIYLAGGVDKEPIVNTGAVYWTVLDVFDPQVGMPPRILMAALESTNRFRLAWRGEIGCNYAVESSPELVTDRWTRVTLPTGSTVTATNGLVETSCPVVPGEPSRFFRVFEAN